MVATVTVWLQPLSGDENQNRISYYTNIELQLPKEHGYGIVKNKTSLNNHHVIFTLDSNRNPAKLSTRTPWGQNIIFCIKIDNSLD